MPVKETAKVTHVEVPIEHLTPSPRNYRSHPESQLKKLEASARRFGQVRSIVVQRKGDAYNIVAGHGFVEAAKRAGITKLKADVIPEDWDDNQVMGYLIADNISGAQDDLEQLAELLESQMTAGYDLLTVGTTEDEYGELLQSIEDLHAERPGDFALNSRVLGQELTQRQIKPVIFVSDLAIVERALRTTGETNRGKAFLALCKSYLSSHGG